MACFQKAFLLKTQNDRDVSHPSLALETRGDIKVQKIDQEGENSARGRQKIQEKKKSHWKEDFGNRKNFSGSWEMNPKFAFNFEYKTSFDLRDV